MALEREMSLYPVGVLHTLLSFIYRYGLWSSYLMTLSSILLYVNCFACHRAMCSSDIILLGHRYISEMVYFETKTPSKTINYQTR